MAASLAIPTLALAHLERPSYWPDPAPDTDVTPAAGGEVPDARSLASAVTGAGPGDVRVVCKSGNASLHRARMAIRAVLDHGFRLRPSQPKEDFDAGDGARLLRINRQLADMCEYHEIQPAVDDSGNNDRIVIMPGRYTEEAAREAPVNDPICNPSMLQEDQRGALTPSYEYQATCENDQNLVHITGRAVSGDPVAPPDPDRHGIPEQELGECIRCNVQLEGSGPRPENVLIDAGSDYDDPRVPTAQPGAYGKHVVIRTDRTDGLVVRNMLLRGAQEHGFYTEETDGVLLDKVKFYWNADYGHLSFTSDHNMIKNCEGMGSGDAAVYPGASPQTGEFRNEDFYPEERKNTVVKQCDFHGNTMSYSGSMGNSVRFTHNYVYGNINGLSTDTLSSPGHPGFPADGMEIDHNVMFSNNLNLYIPDPPFEPYIPQPIGTAIVWAGENAGAFHDNWVFDNWRHGAVLLAVPDAVAGDVEGNADPAVHCGVTGPPLGVSSTSCDNRFFDNHMGQVPPNFRAPRMKLLTAFGNQTGIQKGVDAEVLPNGVDFWWDEFPGNDGNCWFDNTGTDGTEASVTGPGTGSPPDLTLPDCSNGTNPALSLGTGDAVKEAELVDCSMWSRGDLAEDHPLCYWFTMPAQPGSPKAKRQQKAHEQAAAAYDASHKGAELQERLDEIGGQTAFAQRPAW